MGGKDRMGVGKKGPTTPCRPEVAHYLNQLSKQALLDLVVDALGLQAGGEPEDVTLEQVKDFAGPRLRVRGDREPKPPQHNRFVHRGTNRVYPKCAPSGCILCQRDGKPLATREEYEAFVYRGEVIDPTVQVR